MLYAYSSVPAIRDNADWIKESIKSGTKVSTKGTSYSRSAAMEFMEKLLNTWV